MISVKHVEISDFEALFEINKHSQRDDNITSGGTFTKLTFVEWVLMPPGGHMESLLANFQGWIDTTGCDSALSIHTLEREIRKNKRGDHQLCYEKKKKNIKK